MIRQGSSVFPNPSLQPFVPQSLLHGGSSGSMYALRSHWELAVLKNLGAKGPQHLTVWTSERETHPVLEEQSTNLMCCLGLTPTHKFKGFFLSPPQCSLLPLIALTCKVKGWPLFRVQVRKQMRYWDRGRLLASEAGKGGRSAVPEICVGPGPRHHLFHGHPQTVTTFQY